MKHCEQNCSTQFFHLRCSYYYTSVVLELPQLARLTTNWKWHFTCSGSHNIIFFYHCHKDCSQFNLKSQNVVSWRQTDTEAGNYGYLSNVHNTRHTDIHLTSGSALNPADVIGSRPSSSVISVTFSTFIPLNPLPTWEDVRQVSLHEPGSTFTNSMESCKTNILLYKAKAVLSYYIKCDTLYCSHIGPL